MAEIFLKKTFIRSPKVVSKTLKYETQTLTPQCKIICYRWENPTFSLGKEQSNSELSKATRLDISSQVTSCTFSKTLGKPTGTFSFTLSNSPGQKLGRIGINRPSGDWVDIIKRGTWCVIYMSQDGDLQLSSDMESILPSPRKKVRCVGYIDRVAIKSILDENGAFDITYTISGRDFGVVYEDTTIWHNFFSAERIIIDTVRNAELNILGTVTLDKAIKTIHDVMFFPSKLKGAKVNANNSLLEIGLQWLLPAPLVSDLELNFLFPSANFWGSLHDVKNIKPTLATLSVSDPTQYLSGNAWDVLRQISVPQLHELFTETTDLGKPQLNFRPMPFKIDDTGYPNAGKLITAYKDLDTVMISPIDVISFDLGEDNHNRFNSFLLTLATSLISKDQNIDLLRNPDPALKPRFPKHITSSIKRHGFRPMHSTVNALVKNAELGNAIGNSILLKEFNEVLLDYWEPIYIAESGSISIIGNNSIKIGKALTFEKTTPYLARKRYYIEGYTDSFKVEPSGATTWESVIFVTRGFSEEALKHKGIVDFKDVFDKAGEYTPRSAL